MYTEKPTASYPQKLAAAIALLEQVARTHAGAVKLACSLSAEDMVLAHMIESAQLGIAAFVLQTQKLHAQTNALLQRMQASWRMEVQVYEPVAEQVSAFVAQHGEEAMYRSVQLRKRCCDIRKLEPLSRALEGMTAWITGLRQEHSDARARIAQQEVQDNGLIKFNPLAEWTTGDVWHYIRTNHVDYNALHDQFYPSIGCEPCTRAVTPGESLRAGRWWWESESARECGLHVRAEDAPSGAAQPQPWPHSPPQASTVRFAPPGGVAAAAAVRHENAHLDALQEETIYILREVAAAFERPALLFSGGKDSLVMLRCAEKAFGIGRIPYPLLMIDTGHNYEEVIALRDRRAQQLGATLIVRSVEDSMRRGSVRLARPDEPRNAHQSVTLMEAIEEFRFDALIGGARRDEEKARAKERIFSHRDSFGQWQPKNQRPELWHLFNTRHAPDEHFRVFPISNWTELDVWQYIAREQLELPSLYYAHMREVVERRGLLVPVTPLTPPRAGEQVVRRRVRYRTVGDITCTAPVPSEALSAQDVVRETLETQISERGATRMDDQTSEASMEKRKKEGYF